MALIKKYLSIACFVILAPCVQCQFVLKEMTNLGKMAATDISFYPETQEWILSDGYHVFKTWDNFNQARLLFNSYPYYQFSLERLPNKNFYSRHFDVKSPPYGIEYRTKFLDSSRVYIMGDSLEKISNLSPSTYLTVRESVENGRVLAWAANNCFKWGKDSMVICNNGTIGIERKINGKDSLHYIETRHTITAVELSPEGEYAFAGTRDSGWYFIPTYSPGNFERIYAQEKGSEIYEFYMDHNRKQIWILECKRWVNDFISMSLYDYSHGKPVFIKSIKAETLGLGQNTNPEFGFDFEKNNVFIKHGDSFLLQFDLNTDAVVHDFFWELQKNSIQTIHSIYFNTTDDLLYLSAQKHSPGAVEGNNYLYLVEQDSNSFVQIVIPKNQADKNQLYPAGISTVTNRLPQGRYSIDEKISLTSNELALIPYSRTEYLLYNIQNGNMITSFQAVNVDLNAKSRLSVGNTASLSPNGKFIFEWLVKAGITSGIADTLQVALTNVITGSIKRNKIVLSAQNSERILNMDWDEQDRPVFVKEHAGEYPETHLQTFFLDTLLQPVIVHTHLLTEKDVVIYNAWHIPGSKKYLVELGNLKDEIKYSYKIIGNELTGPMELMKFPQEVKVKLNSYGFLLYEKQGGKLACHWYDTSGKKWHTTNLPENFRIQELHNANLYCQEGFNGKPVKINLLNGEVAYLQSKTNPDNNFYISPDENLLVSASEKLQAWQIQQDTLYKLYELVTDKNFIDNTQLTDKYLVSDGRIWNLSTGFLEQADISSKAIEGDSLQIVSIYPGDIINDGGWGLEEDKRYSLKPHRQLFVPSISKAKNLKLWSESFNKVLLTTKGIRDNALQNIYELPFTREPLDGFTIYPLPGQQVALMVKRPYKIMDNDPLTSPEDNLLLLNLQTGEQSDLLKGEIVSMKQLPANGPLLFYLLNQKTKAVQAYKIANNRFLKIAHAVSFNADSIHKLNIVDEHNIVYMEDQGVVFRNLNTNTKAHVRYNYVSGNFNLGTYLYYDNEDRALFIGHDDGGIIKIKDNKVVECMRPMPGISGFAGIRGKYVLVLDKTGNYCFINKETLEADLRLYTWKTGNFSDRKYIWLTRENYYMASPGVENNIHFAEKNRVIPLKQGDLHLNRPDKVLEYLNAPQTDIEFYRQLHEIRVKKYNATPLSSIAANNLIQFSAKGSISGTNILLSAIANATEKLTKFQVTVNGCPLFIPIKTSTNGKSLNQTISIPLNAGPNNIFAWAEDEKGNRSNFAEFKVTGEFVDSGIWHFIGIGVSRYSDTLQNLKYADKDIRNIAQFLSREYPRITIDTIFNELVTTANIRALAERLKNTQPDDKVMISFSGHGLLDKEKKFWYGTHDIDFSHPEQNGFSMNSITALVENIPARYRLITLDACHSGDVVSGFTGPVKTEFVPLPFVDTSGIKGIKLPLALQNDNPSDARLLKSMQMVFTDQLSNTGINLIAASSGTEYALEGEKWKNGVFTYSLINGWSYGARKSSYDRQVHYRDLKQYLQQTVSTLTQGRQTPNTVMENGEIDWWLIPKR